MSIAYLIPIYPMPSSTFIRREISALECQGVVVHRFAMRRFDGQLVDEKDRAEQSRTSFLLETGPFGLVKAIVTVALTSPRRWVSALMTTMRLGLRSERGLIRHLIYLAEACAFRRRLIACNAKHVHAHFGSNAADIALLCNLLGGPPYSITIHGPEDFDAPRPLSLQAKVHHAVFVVAISQYTRSQLYRWCSQEDWSKIHVIHCGLDSEFLPPSVIPVSDYPRLVNVGRLSEQKGQFLLVQAAARLRRMGFEFELAIVGDGPMRGELERLIKRLGLERQVRITGYLSNQGVRQEIQAARALVLPSFAEGLPVVIMEAMAQGRPVISTYVAGIPELVQPGVNGWLVPPGTVQPLVDAMAEALATPASKLEQMGRAGAVRVAERHCVDVEAKKLANLFSSDSMIMSPRPIPDSSLATDRASITTVGVAPPYSATGGIPVCVIEPSLTDNLKP
jgi:glycosyltransferase involved in cell wall biosynthesis